MIGVGVGEMRPGNEAGTQSKEKKQASQEQGLERGTIRHGSVVKLAWPDGAPVDVHGNRLRRVILDRAAHKEFSKSNKLNTLQYSIGAWVCASVASEPHAIFVTASVRNNESSASCNTHGVVISGRGGSNLFPVHSLRMGATARYG